MYTDFIMMFPFLFLNLVCDLINLSKGLSVLLDFYKDLTTFSFDPLYCIEGTKEEANRGHDFLSALEI